MPIKTTSDPRQEDRVLPSGDHLETEREVYYAGEAIRPDYYALQNFTSSLKDGDCRRQILWELIDALYYNESDNITHHLTQLFNSPDKYREAYFRVPQRVRELF